MGPGSIVRFRERDWVLLPGEDPDTYRLRPLAGTEDDAILIHRTIADILGYDLPTERVDPSAFPLPNPERTGDSQRVRLLWNATRLLLRESASPFRSLGRISIRPRTYQLVPLMMALRLDPVRLLIADDVGVGKTIEAGLILRELWDRREIRRIAVLCPPYLCDQWEKELREKFNLEPVVIRSDTISRLERAKPLDRTVYQHFPIQVISIDFVKLEPNKHAFLLDPPECVVVDEAHGATPAGGRERQLRYALVRELARNPRRHLILLTATPHSGIQEAFQKLLGLLDEALEGWDYLHLTQEQRVRLARHFVQRTRQDVQSVWEEGKRLFPKRDAVEATYTLSPIYRDFLERVYKFCTGIVLRGRGLDVHRRRMVWWGALALLRSVSSSPRAAQIALEKRRQGEALGDEMEDLTEVYEPTDRLPSDEVPTPAVERAEVHMEPRERNSLRALEALARSLSPDQDSKLQGCIRLVRNLLQGSHNPVVWCFFVDTAEYVAEELRKALLGDFPDLTVLCVTGRIGEEERREMVQDLMVKPRRVLVATDCLSEGINLQEGFDAVLHYDLPWNPNRLEQREGRVDRYGQPRPIVKAVRYYGRDNPIDGAVLEVLLRKAEDIRKILGTHVPVPQDDESVVEAMVQYLFLRGLKPVQLPLLVTPEDLVQTFHQRWELDARREKENRTRFAQHALKPEEVRRELEAVDQVLGDPHAVRDFVLQTLQRLGIPCSPDHRLPDTYHIPLNESARVNAPEPVQEALLQHARKRHRWTITFTSPTLEGAEYLGRNHPFVESLARYLFESALEGQATETVTRAGAVATHAVRRPTVLLLLRVRYEVKRPDLAPLLAEEVLTTGWEGTPSASSWLPAERALTLLSALPGANLPADERRALVERALEQVPFLLQNPESPLGRVIQTRARELEEAHRRVRRSVGEAVRGLRVEPYWPPDVLAVLLLKPVEETRG